MQGGQTVGMGRVVVVSAFVFLLCGCGLIVGCGLNASGGDGYLLYEDAGDANMVEGVIFVEFVPEGDGQISGSMQWATPSTPNVYLRTSDIRGTVNGTDVFIEEQVPAPGAPDEFIHIVYTGTLEGDEMDLTREAQGVLISYEGEAATLEDFGAATAELAAGSDCACDGVGLSDLLLFS